VDEGQRFGNHDGGYSEGENLSSTNSWDSPGESFERRSLSGSLGVELDFNQLFRFMSRRLELPMTNGRHGALRKDRMSALHVD
jgi:hypothetical protein